MECHQSHQWDLAAWHISSAESPQRQQVTVQQCELAGVCTCNQCTQHKSSVNGNCPVSVLVDESHVLQQQAAVVAPTGLNTHGQLKRNVSACRA
jgi:hypothetical protein